MSVDSDRQLEHDPDLKRARGEAIRQELWGDEAAARLEVIRRFEPGLADMVVRETFGEIYADSRLSLEIRSLCTIASLIAAGRPRQLESHLRAAFRIGIPVETISALFAHLVVYIGLPLVIEAFHVLAKAAEENTAKDGAP